MTSPLGVAVGLMSIKRFINKILNVCTFDYTAVEGSGKVGPVNRLTTPVGWPKLLQLTVLVGPQPLCNRTFCGVVCVVTLPF